MISIKVGAFAKVPLVLGILTNQSMPLWWHYGVIKYYKNALFEMNLPQIY